MKQVHVNFIVAMPSEVNATDAQIREWIAFELHTRGDMSAHNPLEDHELEPVRGSLAMSIFE